MYQKHKIDYKNVVDISELIYKIEVYIEDNYYGDELSDLENLSLELSEFNYYYNTNKQVLDGTFFILKIA